MGRKRCCVCDRTNVDFPENTFFKVPSKDKMGHLFSLWKNFIGEEYYTNEIEIYICESHFESSQIVLGKSRKSLVVGAIPSIKNPTDKIDNIFDQFASPSFKPRAKIISYNDIVAEIDNLLKDYDFLTFKKVKNGLVVYSLNTEPPFNAKYQIFIDFDKRVQLYSGHKAVEMVNYKQFFSKPYVLTTVQEIRSFILNLSDTDLSATHELPEKIFESLNFQYECCELINFFENQLQLSAVSPTNRRYSRDLIVFAYSIYIKSASLYSDLVNFFFLPSIRTIRSYTQPISESLKDIDSNYFFYRNNNNH